MWHVSSRSGVATLRTAIHLLLTYLLTGRTGKIHRPGCTKPIVNFNPRQLTQVRSSWQRQVTWHYQPIVNRRLKLKKGKGSPYSIAERRVTEQIPVLGSQPAGDVSHKPGGRLRFFPPGPQLPSQPLRGLLPVLLLGEQRHNGCEQFAWLTRQRRSCDLNPGPSAPESSTLATRLPSHPRSKLTEYITQPGLRLLTSNL